MQDFKYLIKKEKNISEKKVGKKYLKIILIVSCVIIVFAGANYLYMYVKSKKFSIFKVKKIEIYGIENAPDNKIKNILNYYKGKSLSEIDLKNIYLKLKKIKWIDDVIIRKKYPSQLVINIIEKKPVSIAQINNKLFLIDSNGDIIDKYSNKFFKKEFIIFNAKNMVEYKKVKQYIPQILSVLKKKGLLYDVSDISFKNGYLYLILTDPKIKVIISPNSFESEIYKINVLRKIKYLKQISETKVADLDFKNSIYLTLKSNEESKRSK